ncbi:MAG: hypothetical protein ABIE22_00085 [archaeon]
MAAHDIVFALFAIGTTVAIVERKKGIYYQAAVNTELATFNWFQKRLGRREVNTATEFRDYAFSHPKLCWFLGHPEYDGAVEYMGSNGQFRREKMDELVDAILKERE